MPSRIIFEDEEIRVIHRPGSTGYSLVTFAALTHRPQGTWIWAGPPIEKLDIEAVGIVAKRENWYPAASMRAAAPVVRPLLRTRALGYGYSMGGYGALKYGRLLGLSHGFAVAPQLSIDPGDVPTDRRFHRFHDATLHGGMMVTGDDIPPVSMIAGDPVWPPDGLHLRAAAALPGAAILPLPFLQHAAIDRFTGTRALTDVLDLVLAGDGAAMRAYLRRGRPQSALLHVWLARAAACRGHLAMAERLWARAAALGAPPPKISAARGMAMRERMITLFTTRRALAARAFADTAIDGQGSDAGGLVRLGRLLLRRRMPGKAAICFRRAVASNPALAEAHLGLLEALRVFAPPAAVERARRAALDKLGHSPPDVAAVLALDSASA
jgi:hypothetical protein